MLHRAVLLLGGKENLVSAARALVARSIPVTVVAEDSSPAARVRGVDSVRLGRSATAAALAAWFDADGAEHTGSVVIPLSDHALVFMADRYEQLAKHFAPSVLDPKVVAAMLDKRRTIELARAAGIAVPGQWTLAANPDLSTSRRLLVEFVDQVIAEARFPVVVKPHHTFEFAALTGRKFLKVNDPDALAEAVGVMTDLPGGFSVNEFISGPDSRLASYYAFRDGGDVLLDFTKRIERRYPRNQGGATLHELVDLPEIAAVGRRFFDHVGIEGLASVEFKRGLEDQRWYLIECNYRLTAASELMQRNGIDVVGALYAHALGDTEAVRAAANRRPMPPSRPHYWYPARDLLSAATGEPGLRLWFRTAMGPRVLPYWSRRDPMPSLRHATNNVTRLVNHRLLNRARGRAPVETD